MATAHPYAARRVLARVLPFAVALTTAAVAQDPPPDSDEYTLTIPAFCGYAHPDPDAIERDTKTGAVRECRGKLVFYVEVQTRDWLAIGLTKKAGKSPGLLLAVHNHPGDNPTGCGAFPLEHQTRFGLGKVQMPFPGMLRLELSTDDGSPLRDIEAIHLGGGAAKGAKALTVERRNAASVHLWYETPAEHRDTIEWFCCDLTPKTDPLWTYYMATGFSRGYFGMQVNSATERRVIFSVWDSGGEPIDRDKVAADDRVQLVQKGDGVVADRFGHEGTGGHSHLVHDWQLGDTLRFLVRAQPDGKHTTYTGWFQHRRGKDAIVGDWRLVASFRAPKDGGFLRGLYSFSENFHGANGDVQRECLYGPVWVRAQGGEWQHVRAASFTFDGHGDQHRTDRRGGVVDGHFVLRHGDFVTTGMRRGTRLELPDYAPTPNAPICPIPPK
jgi:hypothetical protein